MFMGGRDMEFKQVTKDVDVEMMVDNLVGFYQISC